MQVLKQILNFYIHSSIHVAVSAVSLTWITFLEFHMPCDSYLLLVVFFASITGYNFVKYFGIAKFHHRSLAGWLKAIQIFSLFCFIFLGYCALQLHVDAILFIGCLGLATFLYAIPFLPTYFYLDDKQNLRNIGGLKVYIIALVWTGVTVCLPIINNEQAIGEATIITGIQRFIFIIALMIPFEIRDLKYDSLKLATLPQKMGVRQTKGMGMLLLVLFFFLEFFKHETSYEILIITGLIAFIISVFIIYSKKEQGKYYCSFWVESIPIIWLLFWLVFS